MKVHVEGTVVVLNGGVHMQINRQQIADYCLKCFGENYNDKYTLHANEAAEKFAQAMMIMNWLPNVMQIQIMPENKVKFVLYGLVVGSGVTIEATNEFIKMLTNVLDAQ